MERSCVGEWGLVSRSSKVKALFCTFPDTSKSETIPRNVCRFFNYSVLTLIWQNLSFALWSLERLIVKTTGLGLPGSTPVWSWGSILEKMASLCLSFLMCKMGSVVNQTLELKGMFIIFNMAMVSQEYTYVEMMSNCSISIFAVYCMAIKLL